jgi:AcrR family transcriptional regulator
MKKKNSIHNKTESRRKEIIKAALTCFTEADITDVRISEICHRSGASVGSIYHHFKSKEQLAAAVFLEGIKDYQTGFISELNRHREARSGIFAIVRYHLKWVEQNTEWANFLFRKQRGRLKGMLKEEFKKMNSDFFILASEWFQKHIHKKTLKSLPPDIYSCILLGPSQEFARGYLAGRTCANIEKAAKEFGEAAWLSLKIADTMQ